MTAELPVDMQVAHFRFFFANGTVPGGVLFADACVHAKFVAEPFNGESFPIVLLQVGSKIEALQVSASLSADGNFDP